MFTQNRPIFYLGKYPITATGLIVLIQVAGMIITTVMGLSFLDKVLFNPELFVNGQVWRLITYAAFDEISGWHVLGLFFFYRFGSEVESALGQKSFLLICGTILLATPILMIMSHFLGLTTSYPVIFGGEDLNLAIFCAFCVMRPEVPTLLLRIPIKWLGLVCFVISIMQQIAARAFTTAFGTALTCILAVWLIQSKGFAQLKVLPRIPKKIIPRKKKMVKNAKVIRSPKPKIAPKTTIPRDTEIDTILDKISAEGLHSLTKEERATLENANKTK